jgi:hypothetical protein
MACMRHVVQDIFKTREAPKLNFVLNPRPGGIPLPALPQGYVQADAAWANAVWW